MKLSFRIRPDATGAVLAAALCCGGCLQLRFERDTRLEPVPKGAVASLAPGTDELDRVLEKLGPPLYAWELPAQGVALAWGWYHSASWQFKFSIPTPGRALSIYLDYGSEAERMRGAVLFFDGDWKLLSVREGLLRDLRTEVRTRPERIEILPEMADPSELPSRP